MQWHCSRAQAQAAVQKQQEQDHWRERAELQPLMACVQSFPAPIYMSVLFHIAQMLADTAGSKTAEHPRKVQLRIPVR